MGNPKTEEEKAAVSNLQKRHWNRCRSWAEALGVHHCAINKHWSCCFSEEPFAGLALDITEEDVEEKAGRFIPCQRKEQIEWGQRQRQREEAVRECRQRRRRTQPVMLAIPIVDARDLYAEDYADDEDESPPDLPARIKIMFWAIKKCGGVEAARDSFERAIRSLEDE